MEYLSPKRFLDKGIWAGGMQMAHATEDPTGEMFWRRVSEWVEGKDAKQCFAKFWAANPTPAPARNVGPRAYVAAAAANSPVRPPGRTTAAGARMCPHVPLTCIGTGWADVRHRCTGLCQHARRDTWTFTRERHLALPAHPQHWRTAATSILTSTAACPV